jgi:hypothetical protein
MGTFYCTERQIYEIRELENWPLSTGRKNLIWCLPFQLEHCKKKGLTKKSVLKITSAIRNPLNEGQHSYYSSGWNMKHCARVNRSKKQAKNRAERFFASTLRCFGCTTTSKPPPPPLDPRSGWRKQVSWAPSCPIHNAALSTLKIPPDRLTKRL